LKDYNIREVNRVSVSREYGSVLNAAKKIATTKIDLADASALVVCCDGLGTFITLRNNSVPVINLCFTPLRAVYDEEYRLRHLQKHRSRKGIALLIENVYKLIDRRIWRRFDAILCISETVKRRVVKARLATKQEVEVSYPGIDEAAIRRSAGGKRVFFLPGRIMWTKNIELGIAAFKQFSETHEGDFELIVAGMVDLKSAEYFSELKEMASDCPAISFEIDPTDKRMRQHYDECYAVLFTAFNEDLGLTPMEAMASGKPVIAVNKGGPEEVVVHNETGYLMPNDVNSFAVAMGSLADRPNVALTMGEKGLNRASKFTWHQFVKDLDDMIDKIKID